MAAALALGLDRGGMYVGQGTQTAAAFCFSTNGKRGCVLRLDCGLVILIGRPTSKSGSLVADVFKEKKIRTSRTYKD